MGPERPTDGDERRAEAEALLKRISDAQERATRSFRPPVEGLKVVQEAERDVSKLSERQATTAEGPLLAPGDVEIDWDGFERLFAEILDILSEWTGEPRPDEVGARQAVPLREHDRETVLALAMRGHDSPRLDSELLSKSFDAAPELFALALRRSLAPFLSAYARELAGGFDAESFLGLHCPVCGAEPFMAELDREDGTRRLSCGLCATKWRFPRMKCPFCGSEEQRKLGFLEVEGYEGYRVHVCDGCRRYIKTVDRRELVSPAAGAPPEGGPPGSYPPGPLAARDLELADVLTPELDRAALESGYRAGPAEDAS